MDTAGTCSHHLGIFLSHFLLSNIQLSVPGTQLKIFLWSLDCLQVKQGESARRFKSPKNGISLKYVLCTDSHGAPECELRSTTVVIGSNHVALTGAFPSFTYFPHPSEVLWDHLPNYLCLNSYLLEARLMRTGKED